MKICVIKGGFSKERDVSLSSGHTFENSIKNLGHELISFDLAKNNILQMMHMFELQKPDLIINALHGTFGEDGTIQGLFESFNIPYTHSNVLSSALSMDKVQSKRLFERFNIKTPSWTKESLQTLKTQGTDFPKPFIMKPTAEGSSIGVHIIKNQSDFDDALKQWHFGDEVLIEEYIKGREFTVSLLDDDVLGTCEVIPKKANFSDYASKYTEKLEERLIPAPITKKQEQIICEMSRNAKNILGCKGLIRTDILFNGKDFYLLELNTQPGFTPVSFAPLKAKQRGWSVDDLVQKIIDSALSHHKKTIIQKKTA